MFLPSDYEWFRMENVIFHEKVRECIIGMDAHEKCQTSDQTPVRPVRDKSNTKVTPELGYGPKNNTGQIAPTITPLPAVAWQLYFA